MTKKDIQQNIGNLSRKKIEVDGGKKYAIRRTIPSSIIETKTGIANGGYYVILTNSIVT